MTEPPIPSDPVFRASGRMRALIAFFLVPPILLLAVGVVWFVLNGSVSPRDSAVLLAAGFGFAAAFGFAIWATFRTSIEILPTAMRFTSAFRGVEDIPFDRIAGYRTIHGKADSWLVIVPADSNHQHTMIAQTRVRRTELEDFVRAKFTNLDRVDKNADMAEAMSDAQLGSSKEERRATLSRARSQTNILHACVFAVMFWAMLYPHPYAAAILAMAVVPLVAVALAISSHGAISFYVGGNSVRPCVSFAMVVAAGVLALRALKDWHILGWGEFWLPFAALGLLLVAILWLGSIADVHRTLFGFLCLSAVCLVQSFGLVLFINCYPDHSVPEIHRTTVTGRRISTGKSTNYYLFVGPWLDGGHSRQISVNRAFYYSHSDGSTVLVGVRRGILQIPWFNVR